MEGRCNTEFTLDSDSACQSEVGLCQAALWLFAVLKSCCFVPSEVNMLTAVKAARIRCQSEPAQRGRSHRAHGALCRSSVWWGLLESLAIVNPRVTATTPSIKLESVAGANTAIMGSLIKAANYFFHSIPISACDINIPPLPTSWQIDNRRPNHCNCQILNISEQNAIKFLDYSPGGPPRHQGTVCPGADMFHRNEGPYGHSSPLQGSADGNL